MPKKDSETEDEDDDNQSTSATVPDTSSDDNVVTHVGPNDVLMGRGAPSTEYTGNMRFRQLVLERRDEYVRVDKRKDKHRIAREIIKTVRSRGGRFLQRVTDDTGDEALVRPREGVAWRLLEDSPALFVKVKQLMRDVGPEARERRHKRRQQRREEEEAAKSAPFRDRTDIQSRVGDGPDVLEETNSPAQSAPTVQPTAQQMLTVLQQLAFLQPQVFQQQQLQQQLQQQIQQIPQPVQVPQHAPQQDPNLQVVVGAILQALAPASPPAQIVTTTNPVEALLQIVRQLQQVQQQQTTAQQSASYPPPSSTSTIHSLLLSLSNLQASPAIPSPPIPPRPPPPPSTIQSPNVADSVLALLAALLAQSSSSSSSSNQSGNHS